MGHQYVLTEHTFPVEELRTVMSSDTAQASQLMSQQIQLATPAGLFPKSPASVGNTFQPPSSFSQACNHMVYANKLWKKE